MGGITVDAYEFYRRRKAEVRRLLLEDYLFRKFRSFIQWRINRGDVLWQR